MSEYIIKAADWAIDYNGESLFKACEEIVRCRDCAYYDDEPVLTSNTPKCWRDPQHRGTAICTRPDGFCAWGEKAVKDESDED